MGLIAPSTSVSFQVALLAAETSIRVSLQDLLQPPLPLPSNSHCPASPAAKQDHLRLPVLKSLYGSGCKDSRGAVRGQAPLGLPVTQSSSGLHKRAEGKRQCCLFQDRSTKFGTLHDCVHAALLSCACTVQYVLCASVVTLTCTGHSQNTCLSTVRGCVKIDNCGCVAKEVTSSRCLWWGGYEENGLANVHYTCVLSFLSA